MIIIITFYQYSLFLPIIIITHELSPVTSSNTPAPLMTSWLLYIRIRPNHLFLQYCNWRKLSRAKHLTFQSVSTATWLLNNCPAPIECIHVCNAFMVHTPGKLTNKAQRMLNILKVSLLLTMQVLITTSGQTFRNIKPLVSKANIPRSGVQDMRNLPVHTYMHSHPFWCKVVPTCQHYSGHTVIESNYSGHRGLLLQHIIYNIYT